MDQFSFSDAEYNGKRKQTRREKFLAEMEQVVPWKRLEQLIEPHYPKAVNGRPPYPLPSLLGSTSCSNGTTSVTRLQKTHSTKSPLWIALLSYPLASSLARGMGTSRSVAGRGLARVDATTGTMISYATKDGSIASDGSGTHNPYTRALLEHLDTHNLEIGLLLRRVRQSVVNVTDKKTGSLGIRFPDG